MTSMPHAPSASSIANRKTSLPFDRAGIAIFLVLTLLPLLYFYPAALGWISLVPGDVWTSNLGVRVLVGRMIAQGQFPLWNPYIFAGMPLLAAIYPGALYPPNWLFAVLQPGAAINVVEITSYHLALFGAYLFARRIGIGRLGAVVTGVTFSFSGFAIIHLAHTHRITAVVWLPWILLAVEELYRRASWLWITLGAVCVALQVFAGEPQMTFYTMLLCGAWVIFSLWLRDEGERRWRFVAALAAMAVSAGLLSAIQMLPQLELLREGERAQLSYGVFAAYSMPPRQIWSLIFPYFFGGAAVAPYKVPYWGMWNQAVNGSYAGLLGLLLCGVAVSGRRQEKERRRLVWFWGMVAVMALILSFGAYLPFGLFHLLHRLPGYNLFRGPYRHLFEFSLAVAVLAGLGMDRIVGLEREAARRAVYRSVAAMAVIVAVTAALYRFGGKWLGAGTSRPAPFGSLTDAEALVPLLAFMLGLAAVIFHAHRRSTLSGVSLIAVLILDLASFGQFSEWRAVSFKADERLADPPTVAFIKSRETDLNSFRILSVVSLFDDYNYLPPHNLNFDLMNQQNPLIARGLQSVCGYDVLRPSRLAAMAGDISLHGQVLDTSSLGGAHQGFDLLNVKYLLRERRGALEPGAGMTIEGLRFGRTPLHLTLRPGSRLDNSPGEVTATELDVVSLMSGSTHVADGTPVVSIKLHTREGRVIERELQAGRDTSEWAWERADVRGSIKHQRAQVAESWSAAIAGSDSAGAFQGHLYLARPPFDRAVIDSIEYEYLLPDAELQIVRASLQDAATGAFTPLDDLPLPAERWRKLASFGDVWVYENLRARPRAWFVNRLVTASDQEILRAVKEGRLPDGQPFDPAQVALLEAQDSGGMAVSLPASDGASVGQAKVVRYEPQRIVLQTRRDRPGFLVLSEIYFRGWEARVDGVPAPIHRADYTLRGVAVLAGEHQVEFVYRPRSFRNGAVAALGGVLLLAGGAIAGRWRKGAA